LTWCGPSADKSLNVMFRWSPLERLRAAARRQTSKATLRDL